MITNKKEEEVKGSNSNVSNNDNKQKTFENCPSVCLSVYYSVLCVYGGNRNL